MKAKNREGNRNDEGKTRKKREKHSGRKTGGKAAKGSDKKSPDADEGTREVPCAPNEDLNRTN